MRAWFQHLSILFFCILMTACAGFGGLSEESERLLKQRVAERSEYLFRGDYERAWEYFSPNYRSVFPKHLFAKQFSTDLERRLTGVDVLEYDAAAAVASVAVRVMSRPTKQTSSASVAVGALPATINEKWVFIDGQWWFSVKG